MSNFSKFSVHVTCDRGLVLIWQHCKGLCISSFCGWHHVFK